MPEPRLSLLSVIPAASVVWALRSQGAPVSVAGVTQAGFTIAVQCWSFRKFTLFEAIEMAAAAGAGSVEFFPGQKIGGGHGKAKLAPDMDDSLFEAIAGKLTQHGVIACNFGIVEVSKKQGEARRIFDFAKRFGMYGITTESIGAINTLEKLSVEYDLKVCFHNHPKPTKLWNPQTIFNVIQGRHENLGFCADLGHWATSGLHPAEVVEQIAPRILSFHMKDRERISGWTHDRPFGTGIIDLAEILDTVRKHGFQGNVSIEYEHNWTDNLTEIAQCVGFLRGYASRTT